MIEYDETEKRMVLKLVYYGPAMSGKTTNLLQLHDLLARDGRGDLMMLDTAEDRTIFFDLLPIFLEAPSGLKIKIKVYTVPGQVKHDATRKAVLQRADGVVFIADSQTSESVNNSESFDNLQNNLALVGLDPARIPFVVQFNKRDLTDVISEDYIRETWKPLGIPVTMASAIQGSGVLETFTQIAELTYQSIDRRCCLGKDHGLTKEAFVSRLLKREPL